MSRRPRRRRPILVDSSPLLLLLVGTYERGLVERFKRTKAYSHDDFDLLVQFLAGRRVIATPGVLAEVSNMAMQLRREDFSRLVERNIDGLRRTREIHIAKDIIIESPEFKKIGATDTSLLLAARENDWEVLTSDHPLCSRCRREGVEATHMMELQTRAEQFM
ncbi:MAG: hypothetical protein ACE5QW_04500 [Thermoplasmata archaeon]